MEKPVQKELSDKLRQACILARKGRVNVINPAAAAMDALALGYSIEIELKEVLNDLLANTTPADYSGRRPPHGSREDEMPGLDLVAFSVEIERFPQPVYYTFSILRDVFWLVSLHKDAEP